jgi:citrate lyase subunit beta / citryl-CoA lyase
MDCFTAFAMTASFCIAKPSRPFPDQAIMNNFLASARSFLFVPANRPERFAKALASGADAVIIDLEDAVSPADKPAAREQLAGGFSQLPPADRARLIVRLNARGTPWHDDDLSLLQQLAAQGLAGVMVPKAESVAGLQRVADAIGPAGALLPLIESVAGLDAADALATVRQVLRLAFGNLDFQADLGLACGPDEAELVPVRLAVVLAARRASLPPPVDGVTPGTQDMAQLQRDAERARRGGFGGKLCIHPAQVAGVNAAFSPSAAELDWAQRVLAAFEAAGGGVFSLDGRMVDAPVVRLAQRTLAQHR